MGGEVIRRKLSGEISGQLVVPNDPNLAKPAGCFVSIHRRDDHALRGCVGIMDTGKPLVQVLVSASEAVLTDPRFANHRITLQELPELELEVTVLGPLTRRPSPLDFEPSTEGIYLTVGERTGCFLPQVARETGWKRDQLLARLCTEKLGLAPDAWKHPSIVFQVFSADVVGPVPIQQADASVAGKNAAG